MDRMDLCVGVAALEVEELQDYQRKENSEQIRRRVEAAVLLQQERYHGTGFQFNSQLGVKEVKKYCYLGEREKRLMKLAYERFSLTARSYYKILKVARTIADLEGSIQIKEMHLSQALGYRMQEMLV